MKSVRTLTRGILFAFAGGLLMFVLVEPAAAQSKKKQVKPVAPRTAEIVSEANAPETAKPAEKATGSTLSPGNAYLASLQDLVALRETELAAAESQKTKLADLARDGLVAKKAVDDASDAIVEARAKLEDAKMRLRAIDANSAEEVESGDNLAADTVVETVPETVQPEPTPVLKKTSVIYPRRKTPAKRKAQ